MKRNLYIHYIILAVIIAAIVALTVSLIRIYTHTSGEVEYASMSSTEATTTAQSTEPETTAPIETEPPYVSPINWIDESVGAILIEGANDDQPLYIMYREGDEEFYLHHDIYGEESVKGSIFADGLIDFDNADIRILYGHHMKDGSMFAVVDDYALDEELFYDSKVLIYYPDHEEDLIPVCVVVGASDGYLRRVDSPQSIADFAQDKTLSVGKIPDTDTFPGQLYCLVTCNYWENNNRSYAFYYGVEREVEETE